MSADEIRTAIRAALDDPRVTTDSLATVAHADQLADQLAAALADTLGQELRHLRRWKNEAMPVMDGLQELGRALDIPLGHSITGPDALAAVEQLQESHEHDGREIARLREEVRRARVTATQARLGQGVTEK
jgi:hypothetical protein